MSACVNSTAELNQSVKKYTFDSNFVYLLCETASCIRWNLQPHTICQSGKYCKLFSENRLMVFRIFDKFIEFSVTFNCMHMEDLQLLHNVRQWLFSLRGRFYRKDFPSFVCALVCVCFRRSPLKNSSHVYMCQVFCLSHPVSLWLLLHFLPSLWCWFCSVPF